MPPNAISNDGGGRTDFQIGQTCRVCLKCQGLQCGLFAMNPSSKDLLAEMFSIKVDDGNPWKICVPCLNSINLAAEFMQMAKNSDSHIRDMFKEKTACDTKKDKEQPENSKQDLQTRKRPLEFEVTGKGAKRTIPCLDTNCSRMFSRGRDMKKHWNYSHNNHTEMFRPSPCLNTMEIELSSDDDDNDLLDNELLDGEVILKNLKIPLTRCDSNEKMKLEESDTEEMLSVENIKSEPLEEESIAHLAHSIFTSPSPRAAPALQTPSVPGEGHTCEVCNAEFVHFAQLLQHKSTHDNDDAGEDTTVEETQQNESPHTCVHCPETFTVRSSLIQHLLNVHGIEVVTQTKERPSSNNSSSRKFAPRFVNGTYICCGITYSERRSFNGHKSKCHREYIQAKACYCNICLVKFPDRKALFGHYKEAHEMGDKDSGVRCNWCERDFSSKKLAFAHKKKMHPELFEG